MNFKDFLFKEIGTSTGDVAMFSRMTIPLVRRMWPPKVSTMYEEDPPGKKKKVVAQPQVKENEDVLSNSILQYLQNNSSAEIGQMVKDMNIDPSFSLKEEDGWSWAHGHPSSSFNQALIALVKNGHVKVENKGWGSPKFSLS